MLVLDVVTGVSLDGIGVAWALAAMIGCATYFIVNGNDTTGLPPLALAAGGLVVGAIGLGVLGLTGVLPLAGRSTCQRPASDATADGRTTSAPIVRRRSNAGYRPPNSGPCRFGFPRDPTAA